MNVRFEVVGDPQAVLGALLGVDPDGDCPECSHSVGAHNLRRDVREVFYCEVPECDCTFARM